MLMTLTILLHVLTASEELRPFVYIVVSVDQKLMLIIFVRSMKLHTLGDTDSHRIHLLECVRLR